MNAGLGLAHEDHPLLGHRVRDTAHQVVGVLRAVAPEATTEAQRTLTPQPSRGAPPVAWLAPERGGREWTTPLEAIREVEQ
ncbi:hypothetical protein [Streptomyces boncukensis]|uniref:Uncharacterized protein n=1 Tax=Streptomyces boncukensis TaxID=2711219 RepID=A0A6G4X552_9ACTN|nr:hypothetical protein [Streptomyces boncukensis]NGO72262.1 hypothetical protein [Streptomyces boncukensis]